MLKNTRMHRSLISSYCMKTGARRNPSCDFTHIPILTIYSYTHKQPHLPYIQSRLCITCLLYEKQELEAILVGGQLQCVVRLPGNITKIISKHLRLRMFVCIYACHVYLIAALNWHFHSIKGIDGRTRVEDVISELCRLTRLPKYGWGLFHVKINQDFCKCFFPAHFACGFLCRVPLCARVCMFMYVCTWSARSAAPHDCPNTDGVCSMSKSIKTFVCFLCGLSCCLFFKSARLRLYCSALYVHHDVCIGFYTALSIDRWLACMFDLCFFIKSTNHHLIEVQ